MRGRERGRVGRTMLQRLIAPRHQLAPPQPFAHVRKRGERGAAEYNCPLGGNACHQGAPPPDAPAAPQRSPPVIVDRHRAQLRHHCCSRDGGSAWRASPWVLLRSEASPLPSLPPPLRRTAVNPLKGLSRCHCNRRCNGHCGCFQHRRHCLPARARPCHAISMFREDHFKLVSLSVRCVLNRCVCRPHRRRRLRHRHRRLRHRHRRCCHRRRHRRRQP